MNVDLIRAFVLNREWGVKEIARNSPNRLGAAVDDFVVAKASSFHKARQISIAFNKVV